MTRAWLSLGSNLDREASLARAIAAMRARFGTIVISPVYESAAVGFTGADFLNCVVGIDTAMTVGELSAWLRELETVNGRVRREGIRFADRTLDIDILAWGDAVGEFDGVRLPRDEISDYAFVLVPLVDLAGDEIHPALGCRYRELLASRDFRDQPLRKFSEIMGTASAAASASAPR